MNSIECLALLDLYDSYIWSNIFCSAFVSSVIDECMLCNRYDILLQYFS